MVEMKCHRGLDGKFLVLFLINLTGCGSLISILLICGSIGGDCVLRCNTR